ncbi:hypothetical protein [Desulfofundulus thermosubterraneus]|uniref:Uncharacterized protein n=1 Tax=Desulfofundulus thermosubterraneus DSM 16057 TaxID=1121432 RepID=A0A1M6B8P6_9FIRM|nr:hypothetical protein [Desulfofundulus thermosubterraneus]SHI44948.1 hypothetical protein SAMN02745219_00343 [Desulfofundulus thermosubterraneus DSM 16057]
MQWYGWRIPIILAALLVGLSFFFAVQWLYDRYNYQEPLSRVLEADGAVQTFSIEKQDGVFIITVRLKDTVDLGETYRRLKKSIQGVLGRHPFTLELKDNRDQELKKAFYYSQFALYEAQIRGNYREMVRYIEDRAASVGAETVISLDEENIYVHMKHRDRHLYAVIPRRAALNPEAAGAPR